MKNRIFWTILLLWGTWLLITLPQSNGFNNPERFVRRAIPILVSFIIIIIINVEYLLPKFYLQKKHALYILWGALLLAVMIFLLHQVFFPLTSSISLPSFLQSDEVNRMMKPRRVGVRWLREMPALIIAFLGSTLWEITRFANIKEKERLSAELKFLKSQVNPHFLFNALNNIYSLSVVQAPQTSESVMQLSEILRYMVYESNEEKVPLRSEINYIENYVDLQLLKDSRGMNVELDLDKAASGLMVAPLLFIPFVENAFKHSRIENLKDGYIKIHLSTADNTIAFRVVNSVPKNNFTKDEVGGVGLENTKKRLNFLYPNGKHQLSIRQTDDQFDVHLKISVQ
ncbi:MAG: histidine kinase [Bacteroidota bacterium]